MESKPNTLVAKPPSPIKKKERIRILHALKVAIYTIRNKKTAKPISSRIGTTLKWKKLFSIIRPLHAQGRAYTQPSIEPMKALNEEVAEEELEQCMSPTYTCMGSSSESRYASAANLFELDSGSDGGDYDQEEDIINDSYFDNFCGDDMIDVKAEQFIAKFYQQMRLQYGP